MKLKQIREMNCGCTVENNVIKMCRMHEAAPELLEAAERLVEAHDRAHAEAPNDPASAKERDALREVNSLMHGTSHLEHRGYTEWGRSGL